jgi:twinkle protein
MQRANNGREQLDALRTEFERFPNFIDDVDLKEYQTEKVAHQVKGALDYFDKIEDMFFGDASDYQGTIMPINNLSENFRIRKNELTIWAGYKGHGKSAILSQCLLSFMRLGEKVFIISPEFRPERVIERMIYQLTQARNVSPDDIGNFFKLAMETLWLYDNQASLKPDDVIALCRYAAQKLNVKHIVIDSLMKCGINTDDFNRQKAFVDNLQAIPHQYPLHLHLVAHARKGDSDRTPPRLHDIKGTSEIADMAENVVTMWRNKNKEIDPSSHEGEPDAIFTVEAQRNALGWIGSTSLYYDTKSMLYYEPGNAPERASYVKF